MPLTALHCHLIRSNRPTQGARSPVDVAVAARLLAALVEEAVSVGDRVHLIPDDPIGCGDEAHLRTAVDIPPPLQSGATP